MSIVGHVVGWAFIVLAGLAWWLVFPVAWGGYEDFGVEKGLVVLWTAVFVILQGIGMGCVLAATGWRSIVGKIVTVASLLMLIALITGAVVGAQPA